MSTNNHSHDHSHGGGACCLHESGPAHGHDHHGHSHEPAHDHDHHGHSHEPGGCPCGHSHSHEGSLKSRLWCIILAAAIMAAGYLFPVSGTWRFALLISAYFLAGWDILLGAAGGVLRGEIFDENFLMAVATIGAVALGDYTEAVAVMIFYKTGTLFEQYAVGRSRRSVAELMDIRPDFANLEENGETLRVAPDTVPVGAVIVVRPGEKIPIDGEVITGESAVDTAALTGESLPRDVFPGDPVISGCINLSGVLRVRTTKAFGQSTVSKILALVEDSAEKKSHSEAFITRFARVYTPAVCCAALALAILPPAVRALFLGLPPMWGNWVTRALTFLVISCPCALVISIPLSFFGGIGGASARGILIKGSGYLEDLANTKHVVFDKTGTLTLGKFQVTAIRPAGDMDADAILEKAALVESFSSHPIGLSIAAACPRTPDRSRVSQVEELSGQGVRALVAGDEVAAGNAKLMTRLGVAFPEPEDAGTVVHVAVNGVYAGYLLISDVIRPTARKAVDGLRAAGVKRVVMLTGDSRRAAAQAAAALGVDEVHAQLLPQDKVAQVERLLSKKVGSERLAFVGDGINDAPVLARADIGVAMGGLGSDAAIEAADVVIMDDDPAKLPLAIKIARKCLGIVRQNIVFALAVKGLCLILGAAGIAAMWLAIFADVGVMVIAVLNAMRALDTKAL